MIYTSTGRKPLRARMMRALGPKALVSWALLLVVAYSITWGLVEAIPNLEITFVAVIAVLGVTAGWTLALIPMKAWMAAVLSLLLGAEYLLIRVGRLSGNVGTIVRGAGQVVGEVLRWYWTAEVPNWAALWTPLMGLWQGMGTLLGRTVSWLGGLLAGGTGFDVVGAALIWGLIVWAYSVWAGWLVRREYHPLIGVLPGSVLLSFVLSYTGASPYIFLPVFGASLVLMALMHQMAREARWARSGIDFSQGLWSDVAMVATGLSIVFMIAGAIAPSITIQRISDWVQEVVERPSPPPSDRGVAESLGLEPRPQPRAARPIESMMSTGLPQRHLIGSGPELSRRVVMVIETGLLPSLPEDIWTMADVPRHYWRSITYDRYFGRGWSTSGTEMVEYEAGELATQMDGPHLRSLRQTVRMIGPQIAGVIHVDGTLVSVDQDYVVSWRPPGEIFAATTEERQYRADSVYPLVTVEELRETSINYPDWIMSRYLQLPDTVPQRVVNLAFELTATEPTPYDRAMAIERYLRETFPYTLDVPTPGFEEDIADYFLFELQEGYCDYYATAMVVLARAAGLPSRLVIGYASGTYEPTLARYVITEADAHAWPEIYFPGYGWIEFEPTAGRPAIVRSSEVQSPIWPEGVPSGPLVESQETPAPLQIVVGVWLVALFGGLLGAIGLVTAGDSMRLYLSSPERMVVQVQRRIRRQARRLRVPLRRGHTPHEVAASLGERIKVIAEAHGFTGLEFLEPAANEVRDLTELYVRIWYSPDGTLSREERWQSAWLWWRLRWRFALAGLWRRSGIQRPRADDTEISMAPEELRRQRDRAQERLRPPPT
jgi:transglutaminase-like putative cysteine protease